MSARSALKQTPSELGLVFRQACDLSTFLVIVFLLGRIRIRFIHKGKKGGEGWERNCEIDRQLGRVAAVIQE